MTDDLLTLAFTGNVYIEHRVSMFRDEGFLRMNELMRQMDLFCANLECAIVDGDEWPVFGAGMGWAGSCLGAPPSMCDELRFLGVNALAAANNHVTDFSERGVLSTMKHLRAAGLPFAGIGASLSEASEAQLIPTAHGRVGLIAIADWGPRERMDLPAPWPAGYLASDDGPWYTSRPGVNLLRYDAAIEVDRQALEGLRRISQQLGWERAKASRRVGAGQGTQAIYAPGRGWEQDSETDFYFMGRRFVAGDTFGFSTFPFPEDLERLCKGVRDIRRQAEAVVVLLHDQVHGDSVHDYVRITAQRCIDAGADVFVCNGGTPKGIEIYKRGVILHGVSNYCFQNSEVRRIPPSFLRRKGLGPDATATDFYADRSQSQARAEKAGGLPPIFPESAESMIETVVLDDSGQVREVRVHPFKLVAKGTVRRLPQLLEPGTEPFQRVLERAGRAARDLGSPFEVRGSYGVVPVG